ncbi:MAG TPA: hypothetical protein PLB52_03820 [Candidatus Moranbacteria bacterium]|nr:hypothetical protein [Candidatus Moranbacteria bacterium]
MKKNKSFKNLLNNFCIKKIAATIPLLLLVFFFSGCANWQDQKVSSEYPPINPKPSINQQKNVDTSPVKNSLSKQPKSLELLSQKDMTPEGQQARRPDVVAIEGELWLAYVSNSLGPMLQRFDSNLNKIGQTVTLQKANEDKMTTDIRVGKANENFWMAYESIISPEIACNEHFLNAASYAGDPPQISKKVFHIAKGCALKKEYIDNPVGVSVNPEITDDPTPFYHNGFHYVLTRAWNDKSVQHLRKLNSDLSVAEDILLDTGNLVPKKRMSQSALLHINDRPYLVAGFSTGMWVDQNTSELYIIPLSDNLRSFSGGAVRLSVKNVKFPTRVTRAINVDGTLIINFIDSFVYPGEGFKVSEYLALFDATSNFSLIDQIKVQDHQVADNHSSFEILDDRLYLFQQQNGEKISAKIFQLK